MRVWIKIKNKIVEIQKDRYAKKKLNEAIKIINAI